jgi:TolA-binding protein
MYRTFGMAILVTLVGCSKPTEEELFKRAVEAQKSNQPDLAIEAYEQLLNNFPQSKNGPEILYALGTIYQGSKNNYRAAVSSYRKLVDQYPDFGATSNALFMIGFIYNNELKSIDSARWAYEEFLKRYPGNPLTESAKFELANLGKAASEILKPLVTESSGTQETAKRSSKKR